MYAQALVAHDIKPNFVWWMIDMIVFGLMWMVRVRVNHAILR